MSTDERRPRLRVAMAQINFKVGDIEANLGRILEAVEQARAQGADLAVFSEMAILGYPPRDLVHRSEVIDRQMRALERVAARTDDDFAVLLGYVDRATGEQGQRLINGAAFCRSGVVHRRWAKSLLPSYDVFDERRYFEPSSQAQPAVINFKGYRLGVSICEDAWAPVRQMEMPRYGRDPLKELAERGAAVIVNLSASPFGMGKGRFRSELLSEHCRRLKRPMIFVNQVGGNDELIFDGRSLAIDEAGEVRARLAEFEEDFQLVEVTSSGAIEAGEAQALRPVADSPAAQARGAAVLGLRDYVRKSGFSGVLIGLSGGIDSSLVAALSAQALGPQNVHGVAMPSRFSSSHSREDARLLGQNLGIEFDEIPIEAPFQSTLQQLNPHFRGREFDVTEENIQARLRGIYLMALSNKFGKLVLACGNKSEIAVGYSTLYGDLCGALMPIGDMAKMLVYDVARLINEEAQEGVIPQRIFEKAPSAELRPDQKDQDSLPPYEVLDEIVARYVEEHQEEQQIIAAGFEQGLVRRVIQLIHRSEYKRWQAPPILKLTNKAFGTGWRYPMAATLFVG